MRNGDSFRSKKEGLKWRAQCKLRDAGAWIRNHSEELKIFVPVAVGAVVTVAKTVGRRANLHKAESIKNMYCYDRSLGHYWRLKRELSNKEWLDIDRRKRNGERLADILSELRVLK